MTLKIPSRQPMDDSPLSTRPPSWRARFLLWLGMEALACTAYSQTPESTLTDEALVRVVMSENPSVAAALADVAQASAALEGEDARFVSRIKFDVGVLHQDSPSLVISGGTTSMTSQAVTAGVELSHTFPVGTLFGARIDYRGSRSMGPLFNGGTDEFELGPGHLFGVKLMVTQPLLRGFGRDVGYAELRRLTHARDEQQRMRDETASLALRTALEAYWEAWYAESSLAIQRSALENARSQEAETNQRVHLGELPGYDTLSIATRVAELEQTMASAEQTVSLAQSNLRRATGSQTGDLHIDALAVSPAAHAPLRGNREAWLEAARDSSYAVSRARIAVANATDAERTATESSRPRLDANAWVQAQGLGNRSGSDALSALGTLENVSGYVGLELELPVTSTRRTALAQASRSAREAQEERLRSAVNDAVAEVEAAILELEGAERREQLASRTAELAERELASARSRVDLGAAVTLLIRQAEDTHRRAQLQVARSQVDAVKARLKIAHATGTLLASWGVDLAHD